MYPLIRFWLYFLMESRSFPHIPEAALARGFPIFCNHFEELQTVLFEVEMIINCAVHYAVKYVYQILSKNVNTQSFVIWKTVVIFS